jgi:hypothetical protein
VLDGTVAQPDHEDGLGLRALDDERRRATVRQDRAVDDAARVHRRDAPPRRRTLAQRQSVALAPQRAARGHQQYQVDVRDELGYDDVAPVVGERRGRRTEPHRRRRQRSAHEPRILAVWHGDRGADGRPGAQHVATQRRRPPGDHPQLVTERGERGDVIDREAYGGIAAPYVDDVETIGARDHEVFAVACEIERPLHWLQSYPIVADRT